MYMRMFMGVVRTHPLRLLLTCVSIAAAFLLFGVLQGINTTLGATLDRMRVDRLLVGPRGDAPPLRAYADTIAKVDGVTRFMYQFLYKQSFPIIFTDPDRFIAVRPEYQVSPGGLEALRNNPAGLLVLDTLAKELNLRIGQQIEPDADAAMRVLRKDGTNVWQFEIVGFISYPDNPSQVKFSLGNYNGFDEARAQGIGTVDRLVVRVKDPARSVATAKAIDQLFENSPAPTRTEAENEYGQAQIGVVGDVGKLSTWILFAVFVALLIVTGNVLMQSVLERTPEFAVLRAVGYSRSRVIAIVLFEALVVCLLGAAIGLALATYVYPMMANRFLAFDLPIARSPLPLGAVGWGLLCAVALAVVSVVIPQIAVTRIRPGVVSESRA
jgi:putative ABC transport system permease protein